MLLSLLQPARQSHLLIAVSATAPTLVNPLVLQSTGLQSGLWPARGRKGAWSASALVQIRASLSATLLAAWTRRIC